MGGVGSSAVNIISDINSINISTGQVWNGGPSINTKNKIITGGGVTGIGFKGEYKIQDSDATAWVYGAIPTVFENGVNANTLALKYKSSVWSMDELGHVAEWDGVVNFNYDVNTNVIRWSGDYSGSSPITYGSWVTVEDYSTYVHHDGDRSSFRLRIRVDKFGDNYILIVDKRSYARGEQTDFAHAKINYAIVYNPTVN